MLAVACGLLMTLTGLPAHAQCVLPPAGLVSWWPLDETTGNAVADVMGRNPGTVTDTVGGVSAIGVSNTSDPMSSAAVVGNGLTFRGRGRVTIKPNPSLNFDTTSFTVNAWIKKPGNSDFIQLFGAGADIFELVVNEAGRLGFTMDRTQWQGLPIKPDTWTFVAAVVDRNRRTVMLYSAEIGDLDLARSGPFTIPADGPPRADRVVAIGPCGDPSVCATAIDEVDIYNVALERDALLKILKAGKSGKCKPTKGMTWRWGGVNATTGTVTVGCGPSEPRPCNASVGDQSCADSLPLLCIRTNPVLPKPTSVVETPPYYYWSGGIVATTAPVAPAAAPILGSLANANKRCRDEFGQDWRLAEFHDGRGPGGRGSWNFQAYGNVGNPNPKNRFWVHIDDQKNGTCFK